MNKRCWSYLAGVAVILTAACGQGRNPVEPSTVEMPSIAASSEASAADTSATGSGADVTASHKYSCAESYTVVEKNFVDGGRVPHGSVLRIRVKHSGELYAPADLKAHLAVFGMYQNGPQELLGSDIKSFAWPDGTLKEFRTLEVQLPPDRCINLQIDAGCGDQIPEAGGYSGYSDFNDAWFVATEYCGARSTPNPTPTPPPTCEGEECDQECDVEAIELSVSDTQQDDDSITFTFAANVDGSFIGGNPQTFEKGEQERTETVTFVAEGGCEKTIEVQVPAKRTCEVEANSIGITTNDDCEPECDVPDFWNQSIESNKNTIKANVHVRGPGLWVLKLFSTSRSSEYPNDPDHDRDTDLKVILCKGQGELKVDYGWKNSSDRYWWAALYRNGSRVWLSDRIDKNDD